MSEIGHLFVPWGWCVPPGGVGSKVAEGYYSEKEQPALAAARVGCADQGRAPAVTRCQADLMGSVGTIWDRIGLGGWDRAAEAVHMCTGCLCTSEAQAWVGS